MHIFDKKNHEEQGNKIPARLLDLYGTVDNYLVMLDEGRRY